MGNYKLSNFVCVDDADDREDVYFYNVKTLNIAKMSRNCYSKLKRELDSGNLEIDKGISYLIDEGYIVDDDDLDRREVELKYIHSCHSNDELLLTVLPTEGCNFRCEYCYEDHKQNVMSEKVQESLVNFVRRNIGKYSGLAVSWFGGEPLLYPEIIEKLSEKFKEICKAYKKPYSAIMTTNGYLLNYDMFKRMKKCRVMNYQITLDGVPAVHDSQRYLANHAPTFNRILDNLKEIKENEKSSLYTFDIRTNLTALSLETYPNFVEILKKNLLDDGRFSQRIKMAWNGTNDKEYDDKLVNYTDEKIVDFWKQSYLKARERVTAVTDINQLRNNFIKDISSHYPCYAAKENAFIFGPDGRVFKCTVHFDDSKEGIVGNLNEHGVIVENRNILSKWITRESTTLETKCSKCVVYPICQGVSCPYKTEIIKQMDVCKDLIAEVILVFNIYSYNDGFCKCIEVE